MSAARNNGGPAFPVIVDQYDYGYEKEMPKAVAPGMTLRDYFAAKWLQGWVANPSSVDMPVDEAAEAAYEMADAMLKFREAA